MGKGEIMRIQAINSNYVCSQSKQQNTNFKGIWLRVGQNYLNNDRYCAGAFYKFIDGKKLSTFIDPRNGRRLLAFGNNGMTVSEGKDAYRFLFGENQDDNGYKAAIKLRNFLASKTNKNGVHNIMFLEKEDVADVTAKRERIGLDRINILLREYEKSHNLVKVNETPKVVKEEKLMTHDELIKMLTENSFA